MQQNERLKGGAEAKELKNATASPSVSLGGECKG